MTADASKTRKCPACGRMAPEDPAASPFCSKRCKQADLGMWFLEEYRVPVTNPDPSELEALEHALEQAQTQHDDDKDLH